MSEPQEPTEITGATVYYDGACPLCTLEIDHYRTREGAERLRFVDVSDEGADPGPDLGREDALKRFHVRRADGTLAHGAAGFVEVWATLPRWLWLARVARVPGVLALMELAYRAFLPVRPYLSRVIGRVTAHR